MGEADLTEGEMTGLRWMRTCNSRGIGFLGPTVRKEGPLEAYERLVQQGFAKLVVHDYHNRTGRGGYWLLPEGRQVLSRKPPTASPDTASVVSEDQYRDQSSPRPDGP